MDVGCPQHVAVHRVIERTDEMKARMVRQLRQLLQQHLLVGAAPGWQPAVGHRIVAANDDVQVGALFQQDVGGTHELRKAAIGLHPARRVGHDFSGP